LSKRVGAQAAGPEPCRRTSCRARLDKLGETGARFDKLSVTGARFDKLSVTGARFDKLSVTEMGLELRAPGGARKSIGDAKHFVNVEQPEAFNRILLDWLATHRH
jgi:pimeloyl-ACP methyl ester carboxylesterase